MVVNKNLGGKCKRTLPAILNKSLKQHPTKQLYGHLTFMSKKHPSETQETCGTILEKQEGTHE